MPGCCHQGCAHVSSCTPSPPPPPVVGAAEGNAAVLLVSSVTRQTWDRLYFIDIWAAVGFQCRHRNL